jgi:hypothetical protein
MRSLSSGLWMVCLVFGAGLAALAYTLAVAAIGKVRDLNAGSAAGESLDKA